MAQPYKTQRKPKIHRQQYANKHNSDFSPWVNSIIQLLLFLATLGAFLAAAHYVGIANKQWVTMDNTFNEIKKQTNFAKTSATAAQGAADAAKRSVNIAEKTMIGTQRPWLDVRLSAGSDLQFSKQGGLIIINFMIKNVGHSPALNIFPYSQIVILSKTQTDLGPEQKKVFAVGQAAFKNKRDLSFGHILFPNDEFSWSWPVTFSQKDIEEGYKMTKSKVIAPLLFGCVFYRFAFDQSVHRTGFITNINRLDPSKNIPGARFAILPEAGNVPANLLALDTLPSGSYAD